MENLHMFGAYAADFEKTLADDDWSRLDRYFTDDAVYEVVSEAFPCTLRGPRAIFAGMKKSLDGFDRKFTGRDIDVTSGPELDGDELRVGWTVTYRRDGVAPFALRGRSTARFRDGRIAYLRDAYDPGVEDELGAWQRASGIALDPSYT